MAHWYHPDIVYKTHCDYIRAGARIIITNSFHGAKHILDTIGQGDKSDLINKAERARDDAAVTDVWIAGSMSTNPSLEDPLELPRGHQVAENYKQQAHVLAESGVDLIMCEMLNYSEASLKIIEMVLTTSLPVFAGVSASIRPDYAGQLDAFRTPNKLKNLNREPFEDLVKNVAGTGISAMAVMHTKPALMDSALKKLRKYWQGSAMAYAETGEFSDERWCFENAIDTHTYAQLVAEWNEKYNLQIVGGCCGTTINHTHDMNSRLT